MHARAAQPYAKVSAIVQKELLAWVLDSIVPLLSQAVESGEVAAETIDAMQALNPDARLSAESIAAMIAAMLVKECRSRSAEGVAVEALGEALGAAEAGVATQLLPKLPQFLCRTSRARG